MSEQKPITGYRQLSSAETDLINRVKAHAEATQQLLGEVHQLNGQRFGSAALRADESIADKEISRAESNRWTAVAKTQLQQGYMALNRAIALPTTF